MFDMRPGNSVANCFENLFARSTTTKNKNSVAGGKKYMLQIASTH
jgi:hypothetical protein